MKVGANVLGLSAMLLGAVGLRWVDFAAVWQPVPQTLPGRAVLACLTALVFFGAGVALQSRRWSRPGAVALALLFSIFAVLWLPRVAARPLIFATWGGVAEQLVCVFGAVSAYAWSPGPDGRLAAQLPSITRMGFGVCAVAFGFNHIFALPETAAMTPKWLPPGPQVWAAATGVFHLLGGVALFANEQALLAARLLTAMFASFGLLVWLPILWRTPGDHMAWCGNAINLTMVGAAWALSDQLAFRRAGAATPA